MTAVRTCELADMSDREADSCGTMGDDHGMN